MTKEKKRPESALCASFIDFAAKHDIEIHSEPAGWDLFAERNLGEGETELWGIQAKAVPNDEVICQAMDGLRRPKGPQVGAVLVPRAGKHYRRVVIEGVGLALIVRNPSGDDPQTGYEHFDVLEPNALARHPSPPERCDLPQYVNATPAGSPSPSNPDSASFRMQAAMEVFLMASDGGFLTKKQIERTGWRIDDWGPPFWLERRDGHYVPKRTARLPSAKQPSAFRQIKEKMESKGLRRFDAADLFALEAKGLANV